MAKALAGLALLGPGWPRPLDVAPGSLCSARSSRWAPLTPGMGHSAGLATRIDFGLCKRGLCCLPPVRLRQPSTGSWPCAQRPLPEVAGGGGAGAEPRAHGDRLQACSGSRHHHLQPAGLIRSPQSWLSPGPGVDAGPAEVPGPGQYRSCIGFNEDISICGLIFLLSASGSSGHFFKCCFCPVLSPNTCLTYNVSMVLCVSHVLICIFCPCSNSCFRGVVFPASRVSGK